MTNRIESQQGCCEEESDPEPPEIETQQGCCGGESTEPESACSSDVPAGDLADNETPEECCGNGTTRDDFPRNLIRNDCCGEPTAGQSSCDDDAGGSSDEQKRSLTEGNQKSSSEQERIRIAGERTEALLEEMTDAWAPGWTESDVSEFLHYRLHQMSYEPAWAWDYCPAVHAGADAGVGHTLPSDRPLPAGELLHVDFGVTYKEYVADLQRLYYYPTEPDEPVPDEIQSAFEDVRAAIDAGREALEPGVHGYEVDAAARAELTDRGWSEFNHAFGHQVGQIAHDAGTLLGPRWERFGDNPYGEVRVNEVYCIEVGVGTTYGYIGQEEMVYVVNDGNEYLVEPQTKIRRLESK